MAKNKYTGEQPIKIGTKQCTLVYDWRAVAALKSKFKKEQFEALLDQNPADLAEILQIGLQKHHSDITVDAIMDSSPVVADVAKAIDTALLYAYYGPEKAETILAEMEKIENAMNHGKEKKEPKKK